MIPRQPSHLRQCVIARKTILARYLTSLLLLSSIGLPASGLTSPPESLPGWREVSFERHSTWGSARSKISIMARNDYHLGPVWVLQVEESIAENRAQETQLMTHGSGRLLRRSRLSHGRDTRLKEYHHAMETLVRIRREPDSSSVLPSAQWPVSSRQDIPYPALEQHATLTSMHALLLLAGSVLNATGQTATVYVHGDVNFYRVRLSVVGEEALAVDFSLGGGRPQVKGERTAIVVGLQVDPVGMPRGGPEFSLLGLDGQVSILLDEPSRLPLQVRGRAPLVGETSLNLVSADIGPPAREQLP